MSSRLSKKIIITLLIGTLVGSNASVFAKASIKDDFYEVINKEWLQEVEVSPMQPVYTVRDELSKRIEQDIKVIIKDIQANHSEYAPDSEEIHLLNMYESCMDLEARKERDVEVLLGYLNRIGSIESKEDLAKVLADPELMMFTGMIGFWKDPTTEGEKSYILGIDPPQLHLYDPSLYGEDAGSIGAQQGLRQGIISTWMRVGKTEEEATQKAEQTLQIEKILAKGFLENNMPPTEYEFEAVQEMVPHIPLTECLEILGVKPTKKTKVWNVGALKQVDQVLAAEDLEAIKGYLETGMLMRLSSFIVDDLNIGFLENRTQEEKEAEALFITSNYISTITGKLYAKNCLDPKAQAFALQLAEDIKEVHKQNIYDKEWMSDETKAKAVEKLDKIRFKIGAPTKWDNYGDMNIRSTSEGGSYLDNIIQAQSYNAKVAMPQIGQPVDPDEWLMRPHKVSAYYDPATNEMVIPAAMLEAPYYDETQSYEQNLAGIGGVIAHEMIHAFDTLGSQFDAEGNKVNWWNDEEQAYFAEEALKVEEYFSSIEVANGAFINGKLTVGENISDIGAVHCLLQLTTDRGEDDYAQFFEHWAHVFGQKITDEALKQWLMQDPHAPYKYRVNGVLPQFETFYETYDIKEGDAMYVAPENRVGIW